MTSSKQALVLDGGEMFARIEDWLGMTGLPSPEIEPGSPLAGDARKSPEHQVAHGAWMGVVHAVDHLHAVKTLIADARVVHPHATYTLLRSAMENAATAMWLLEPPPRPERLRRRLKLAHHEAWESSQVRKVLPTDAPVGKRSPQERMDAVRDLARSLHLDPSDVSGRFSYESVVRSAGEASKLGADLSALLWRLCSGFAHGRYWASLSFLERTEIARAGESGVLDVRLSSDVDQVLTVAQAPFLFTSTALRLYDQRRQSPFSRD